MDLNFIVRLSLLASCLHAMTSQSCRQDPENGWSHLHYNISTTTRFYPDPKCLNGSIAWNYPKGSILVNFQIHNDQNFNVCLRDANGAYSLSLIDESFEIHRHLQAFMKDDPVMVQCLQSHNGQVRLLMLASSRQISLAELEYTIIT